MGLRASAFGFRADEGIWLLALLIDANVQGGMIGLALGLELQHDLTKFLDEVELRSGLSGLLGLGLCKHWVVYV